MQIKNSILVVLLLFLAPVLPLAAHSLEELQGQLGDREKYFQPTGRKAPDFTLEDAEGRAVALQGLHGKVVVLHFVYTRCPDVCPLHAERIAEIQEMVNRTSMRELVQFVTITTMNASFESPKRDHQDRAVAKPAPPLPDNNGDPDAVRRVVAPPGIGPD